MVFWADGGLGFRIESLTVGSCGINRSRSNQLEFESPGLASG